MLHATPLNDKLGYLIQNEGNEDILDLPGDEVMRLLMKSGVLAFRGFKLDLDRYRLFTEKYGREFLVNGKGLRDSVADEGMTQTVNSGRYFMSPHNEMGYMPLSPELIWFYYSKPARKNGETYLCDGIQLFAKLPSSTREIFLNKRIKYIHRGIQPGFWKQLGYNNQDQLYALLSSLPSTTCRFNKDDTVDLEYTVAAARKPRYQDEYAFTHSIHNHNGPLLFEDGTEIPTALKKEILVKALSVSAVPKWKAQDLIMIDNSRVMHGRNAFDDPERLVYVRIARHTKHVYEHE
jgi:alpha-ketoglutarate-dependent taurine dioxygenase